VAIGIVPPKFWGKAMGQLIGSRVLEKYLTMGKMAGWKEALEVGLVDEVVSKEELLDAALRAAASMLKRPYQARARTKAMLRNNLGKEWENFAEEETGLVWQAISQPGVNRRARAHTHTQAHIHTSLHHLEFLCA